MLNKSNLLHNQIKSKQIKSIAHRKSTAKQIKSIAHRKSTGKLVKKLAASAVQLSCSAANLLMLNNNVWACSGP